MVTALPSEPMNNDRASNRNRFISGMSHAANTVSVVTTDGPAGRSGVTVSSMSSVSADSAKPTLLVCVHHLSPVCNGLLGNRVFCVNLLRDDQSFVADTFAGRTVPAGNDKFNCTTWTKAQTGAPVAVNHLVAFDCELIQDFRVGSHIIFVGQVVETIIHKGHAPLIYANRGYGTPMRFDKAADPLHESTSDRLRIGCHFTFAPVFLPRLVSELARTNPDTDISFIVGHEGQLQEALRSHACDVAFSYNLDRDRNIRIEELAEARPHVLLPAGHELAKAPHVSLHDLAPLPMVLLQRPPSEQYFIGIFEEHGLEPLVRYRTPSFEMVRAFVGRSLGYSILMPRPATDATYEGTSVVTLPLSENVSPGKFVLATLKGKQFNPAAKEFMHLCRSTFMNFSEGPIHHDSQEN